MTGARLITVPAGTVAQALSLLTAFPLPLPTELDGIIAALKSMEPGRDLEVLIREAPVKKKHGFQKKVAA